MDKLPPGSYGIPFSQYVETRFNLLLVASDKLEVSVDRRFGEVEASTVLAANGVDIRFKHLEQIVGLGQESAKRAVDKAEAAQAAHNVASNEWRNTLNDFKTSLVGRAEFDKLYQEFASNKLEVSKIIAAQSAKSTVVDPQMQELIARVGALVTANAQSSGKGEGISNATAVIVVAATLIIAALGVFVSTRNGAPGATAPVPNVIYIPAPPSAPTTPQPAPR